ncbi:hypothetical protein Tco_0951771 [Tanacetum coccineum]|uniref:Uncharacterized protein n=1 Tax=Tanacetum coccineum TaxID=301880 RepID=A0ABQ5DV40_9ASTR
MFFLKYGNTKEKKYILLLHKIHVERFPKADLEEKMNHWVRKEFKTFNEEARLSIQHWKDSWYKMVYKQKQIRIVKFCDATVEMVLNEVKLKIFQSEPWKKSPLLGELDQDIMRAFEREITKRLMYWVRTKEMEACDPFICNDTYKSESSNDEEDAKYDMSQSGDKVTTDNDVERRKYSGDDLKYPPGFTPSKINVEEVNKKVKGATSNEVNEHSNSTSNMLEESVPKQKLSSNNSVCWNMLVGFACYTTRNM